MSGFGIKDCSTEASLGWKCFGKYKRTRLLHTFNDKFVRVFTFKSIKGGRMSTLNKYFKSNPCEEIPKTIKKR